METLNKIPEYHITEEKFLLWYFEDGQDSENESIRADLVDNLITDLFGKGKFKITTKKIFDSCNKLAIPIHYIEEFEDENFTELGDLNIDCKLKLIK